MSNKITEKPTTKTVGDDLYLLITQSEDTAAGEIVCLRRISLKDFVSGANLAKDNAAYAAMHAGLADNLFSPDNKKSFDGISFRITGSGDALPGKADAQLAFIQGNCKITGENVTEVINATSSNAQATVTVAKATWRSSQFGAASGDYAFTFSAAQNSWQYNGTNISLASYGLSVVYASGSAVDGESITVHYVKAEFCNIDVANPSAFKAIGLNAFDAQTAILSGYTINSAGKVVEQNNSYVCYVKAVGGLAGGYVAYSSAGGIARIGWCANIPTATTEGINLSGAVLDQYKSYLSFENDGYVCIATTAPATLCVHPKLSGQKDMVYEAYSEDVIDVPTVDADGTALPTATYGMPSVGNVRDELSFDLRTYTKRIGQMAYSEENLTSVMAMGTAYIYDDTNIFYVLENEIAYPLADNVSGIYAADDFGTEEFDADIPVYAGILYGENLREKLRSNVLTISAQTLSALEKAQILQNIGAAGADAAELKSRMVTVITNDSDDQHYPSAGAVLHALEESGSWYPRYGVLGIGNSASALTRIWDSVGKTALPGTDLTDAASDFDDCAPFNRKKCVGNWVLQNGKAVFNVQAYYGDSDYAEDGTKGDYVAIDVEPFWWYQSADKSVIGVSPGPQPGFRLHPICQDQNGNARPHTFIPAYELAFKNGHAVSLPGYHPEFGCYRDIWNKARTYNNSDLTNYCIIEPSAFDHYNWLLMTIEFATKNMQNIMAGATSMEYSSSDTLSKSGTNVNSVVVTAAIGGKFLVGQSIYLGAGQSDTPSGVDKYNVITNIQNCDADGNPDPSGTYRLITFDGDARTVTASSTKIASRPWITGSTNLVRGHTGSPASNTDSQHPCLYRWLENPYGNINKTCLDMMDVRVDEGSSKYHLDWYYNPSLKWLGSEKYFPSSSSKPDLADLEAAANGWEKIGETPTDQYKDGYIKELSRDDRYPEAEFPVSTTGGSATTYYCDYAYLVNSYSVRAVRRRGYLATGATSGPRYVSANTAPSDAYWSSGGGLFMLQ